jgi:PAS domain-containing protein
MGNVTQLHEFGFDLFEPLLDAVLAPGRRGITQYANRQAGRLLTQEPATLVSAPVEALIPEHLREGHIAHRAKCAQHAVRAVRR